MPVRQDQVGGYGISWVESQRTSCIGRRQVCAGQRCDESATTIQAVDAAARKRVEFYIHDQLSSVTRPVKELKGFERVTLKPGETKTVTFKVGPEALRFYNADMKRVVEPGAFDIMVGPNSVDLKKAVLTVTSPAPRPAPAAATQPPKDTNKTTP